MEAASDEDLYRQFLRGNAGAFERLYSRYREPLYRFLLRTAPSDAEDLCQETWTRVIHARERFQDGSFRAWLYRIARNLHIDLVRRRTLRPVADGVELEARPDPAPAPESQVDAADCGRRLLTAIGTLPPEQREAFLLQEEAGLTLEQIGTLLSLKRETIKSRLRYALQRLRAALEDCL
jgi:RNA polymerase sigma-70 factor (ECF subfamily)